MVSSTYYNALILGMCSFLAPGIWGTMNSLGDGGASKPYLVNAANALTFCLMVLSYFFGSVVIKFIGIKWTLIVGTMGYAPYAAGIYTQVQYESDWLALFGAALCGISAKLFWIAEPAIAFSYPEPQNQGRFLGFWRSFRVGGQIVGGECELYGVERTDGVLVKLRIANDVWFEIKAMIKLLSRKFRGGDVHSPGRFRLVDHGHYIRGFSRAFLDSKVSLKLRSWVDFLVVLGLQDAWWLWGTIVVTDIHKSNPVYDWSDSGFGRRFPLYVFWVVGFQLNYMFLYFIVGNLAKDEEEVVWISSLLRGMESASQVVSYGLSSVSIMASVGSIYLNSGLRALTLFPAWLIIREMR
ncbi:hypothetical protein BDW71DRAFT_195870 [Aspergillus fruticulosus]